MSEDVTARMMERVNLADSDALIVDGAASSWPGGSSKTGAESGSSLLREAVYTRAAFSTRTWGGR